MQKRITLDMDAATQALREGKDLIGVLSYLRAPCISASG